jgi:hypothetical protein
MSLGCQVLKSRLCLTILAYASNSHVQETLTEADALPIGRSSVNDMTKMMLQQYASVYTAGSDQRQNTNPAPHKISGTSPGKLRGRSTSTSDELMRLLSRSCPAMPMLDHVRLKMPLSRGR